MHFKLKELFVFCFCFCFCLQLNAWLFDGYKEECRLKAQKLDQEIQALENRKREKTDTYEEMKAQSGMPYFQYLQSENDNFSKKFVKSLSEARQSYDEISKEDLQAIKNQHENYFKRKFENFESKIDSLVEQRKEAIKCELMLDRLESYILFYGLLGFGISLSIIFPSFIEELRLFCNKSMAIFNAINPFRPSNQVNVIRFLTNQDVANSSRLRYFNSRNNYMYLN